MDSIFNRCTARHLEDICLIILRILECKKMSASMLHTWGEIEEGREKGKGEKDGRGTAEEKERELEWKS